MSSDGQTVPNRDQFQEEERRGHCKDPEAGHDSSQAKLEASNEPSS